MQDLLPPCCCVGSLDRTLRCWDVENGIQRAVSRPHGGTVRSLAVDDHLIASGSSDHQIRVWRRGSGSEGVDTGSGGSTDITGRQRSSTPCDAADGTANSKGSLGRRAVVSGGHSGPVTSLELTPDALISGSWDCTVRVWDRSRLECRAALQLDDWVSSLAASGPHLCIGCGKEALVYSAGSGAWRQVQQAAQHNGAPVTAVRGTLDGRYLFFGTGARAAGFVSLAGKKVRQQSSQGLRSERIKQCSRQPAPSHVFDGTGCTLHTPPEKLRDVLVEKRA